MGIRNDEIDRIIQRKMDTSQRNRSINKFIYKKLRFNKILYFLASIKLKKLNAKCKSFEDYINLIASFHFSLFKLTYQITIWALQSKSEIKNLCKIVSKIHPKTILEIGTANGGTLFLFTRLMGPNSLILSINYEGGVEIFYRENLYKGYITNKQEIIYLIRDSHWETTLRDIKQILRNRKIDMLFIDGDHSYGGVKKDFEMYSPLVKKNGIIAFHDIVVVPPEIAQNVEVNKFWNEIKKNYEYLEIVDDWNRGWGGIGLITMK